MTVTRFVRERASLAYLSNSPLAAFKGIPAFGGVGQSCEMYYDFFFFFLGGGVLLLESSP